MFDPIALLDFIELPQFTKRWEKLGLNDEDDLYALQTFIMANPNCGEVIQGAGGLRKMRFAPERWRTGASGAARVLYVHFVEHGIVLLCLVYGKNEVETISDAVKLFLKKTIREIEKELKRRKSLR